MTFRELVIKRRSRRVYTGVSLPEKVLTQIVEAGLLAPTGRNLHPAEVIVVRDKAMLERRTRENRRIDADRRCGRCAGGDR